MDSGQWTMDSGHETEIVGNANAIKQPTKKSMLKLQAFFADSEDEVFKASCTASWQSQEVELSTNLIC